MRSAVVSGPQASLISPTFLDPGTTYLDRCSTERASPQTLSELATDPETRYVLLSARAALLTGASAGHSLRYFSASELPVDPAAGLDIFLGRVIEDDGDAPSSRLGHAVVVKVLDADQASAAGAQAALWRGYREVAPWLPAVDAAVFTEALAISNWHETHRHCPRCGTGTVVQHSGWVRLCPQDATEHFPRMDPAIIVTVVGPDDRLLLGGGGPADGKGHSTLAGFVDPGESLEAAVAREIGEEVNVRVAEVQYLGSQHWPFPASLMLGFTARTLDTEARVDGVEVTHARWFSREELQSAVLAGEVIIPGRVSIARRLIEHWFGGPIQEPEFDR